ncbi:hydroxymethylglutaryl-CoA lyase [Rheinheimera sp. UJ63]|uniref:hydroxymethylglutaryl-CoA lyase n=1 Tax=Rheinheimera sp. UJ63 TaxID=2910157 RepID=UPI001F18934B|nr:hydroxymethylglutaryl-CoA lyase [Rheinheimera sp. UJ63]MCF4008967.1 hydroxymethylglutaryl-CoA lyase [Rheinheimera sp. UJ63]
MSNKHVTINDVGPRDGLQNQAKHLTVEQRLQLINALLDAKVPAIEVGALVSPKAVPAMAGTDSIISQLPSANCDFSALIPNRRGYDNGHALGIPMMSLVLAASNTMNEKNIRMNTAAILDVSRDVLQQAKQDQQAVQAYVATAWGCPFEGAVEEDAVLDLCDQLLSAGAARCVIADTIGAANPEAAFSVMTKLVSAFGADKLSCHFHDTRAMGLANVYAALQTGIRHFDSSIAGLGGCPFAPGASGNVATEDVVMMLSQMGYATGIEMPALLAAADLAIALTGTAKGGKAKYWLEQQQYARG